MTANEAAIRKAYQVAENKDITSDFEGGVERYEALTPEAVTSGSKPDVSRHTHDCSRRRGCGV